MAATGTQSAIGTGVVLAIVVLIAGMVAVLPAQLSKAQAMMTQAAYEVAHRISSRRSAGARWQHQGASRQRFLLLTLSVFMSASPTRSCWEPSCSA